MFLTEVRIAPILLADDTDEGEDEQEELDDSIFEEVLPQEQEGDEESFYGVDGVEDGVEEDGGDDPDYDDME